MTVLNFIHNEALICFQLKTTSLGLMIDWTHICMLKPIKTVLLAKILVDVGKIELLLDLNVGNLNY